MERSDSCWIGQPQLPPGFRFHPTDEELVVHYLKKKAASAPLPVAIIADVDLYKFDPWELPAKAVFGEQEWYFFSPRDRKYPNGARPNRAANSGYWKATGTDKPVLAAGGTVKVGLKKALVFYGGKPPRGMKTNWIMHEYRLADNNKPNSNPDFGTKKNSLRLDDWVLCRIYKKNSNTVKPVDRQVERDMNNTIGSIPQATSHELLENDQNYYKMGMMNSRGLWHPPNSAVSMKRTLPLVYWNSNEAGNYENSAKAYLAADHQSCIASSGDETTSDYSIASILGQLSQNPSSIGQHTMVGNLGDEVLFGQHQYQVPGMNWYS